MNEPHRCDLRRESGSSSTSCVIAEDGSANEYTIWTPRSWSDDDSLPASIAGKSTEQCKLRDGQGAAQVPQELLEVIERQDAVIERLVTWCQTLEDQAIAHRMKLVEHEKAKDESENFRTTLRSELATLKKSARKKAKEHSLEANQLYERLQSKVDSRVSAWCSRQEGICKKNDRVNRSVSPHRIGSPCPGSQMQGVGSSQLASNHSKVALGTPALSHGPSNDSIEATQRLPTRSHSMIDLVPAATRSSPLREAPREVKCFESSASLDCTRLSKRKPPKATSPGKKISSNGSQKNLLTFNPASIPNSVRPEMQNSIRDGVSPRSSLKSTQSKANLDEPVPPLSQQERWSTPGRARQSGRKASQESMRFVRQPPTSPGRGASKSPRSGASESKGQGFKFLERSASSPGIMEDRVVSPKRSPRKVWEDSSPSRSTSRRRLHAAPYQEKVALRTNCGKSSFAPPPRVGSAGTAGLVMQSYSSPSPGTAQWRIPAALGTPPPSPSKSHIFHSNGNIGIACPGAGLGLTPQSSMAALAMQSTGEAPSPRKIIRGTCAYTQASCIINKLGRSR